MKKIGVIGYGRRISLMIDADIKKFPDMTITAITDVDLESAKDRIKKNPCFNVDEIAFYTDAKEMLDKEDLDGVMIGTRCNLHTEFAIEVLKRNIPVFLEKPVAISLDELEKLQEAVNNSDCGGITSFPLRLTLLVEKAKEIYDSGVLGTLSQIQAYNNVNYGRVYYKAWYRDDSITGGLFLQKATHDIDYINYVLGKQPIELCAMESKMIFKGDKPNDITCDKCPEQDTCYESSKNIMNQTYDNTLLKGCSFGDKVGNHDSATILMRYDDGLHAVYTQNFVARCLAGKRGMRMIGHKATLEFDWNKDTLVLFHHNENKKEEFLLLPPKGTEHSGGDTVLLRDFYELMNGNKSVSSIQSGLNSAYVCLKARESAQTHKFVEL